MEVIYSNDFILKFGNYDSHKLCDLPKVWCCQAPRMYDVHTSTPNYGPQTSPISSLVLEAAHVNGKRVS